MEGMKDGMRMEGMLYLMTHSTHFITIILVSDIWQRTTHEIRNLLQTLHGLLFSINSKGSLTCTILQTGQYILQPLVYQLLGTDWNRQQCNVRSTEEVWSCDPRPSVKILSQDGVSLQNSMKTIKTDMQTETRNIILRE